MTGLSSWRKSVLLLKWDFFEWNISGNLLLSFINLKFGYRNCTSLRNWARKLIEKKRICQMIIKLSESSQILLKNFESSNCLFRNVQNAYKRKVIFFNIILFYYFCVLKRYTSNMLFNSGGRFRNFYISLSTVLCYIMKLELLFCKISTI